MLVLAFLLCTVAAPVLLVEAAVVPPPGNSTCWSSTFGVLQNEIGAALNPTISLEEERHYVFCSGVYKLVNPDPATGVFPNATEGGQWPLLVFNPNVHLSCPDQDCVLEMQTVGSAIFAAITPIVASAGLVPDGLTAPNSDITNLIIDGFTFRNVDGIIFDDTNGVVTLGPPGTDIVIKNCAFETVGLAGWAIASEYYASEAALKMTDDNSTDMDLDLYQSVSIMDCTFADSAFDRAAIISFAVDSPPDYVTNIVTLERLVFTNSTNTGLTRGGGRKGFLFMENMSSVSVSDVCFMDVATPSGALIELQGQDSLAEGIYESGTTVMNASGLEEDCLGGILLMDECVPVDAAECTASDGLPPMMDTDEPTMASMMDTDEPTMEPTSSAPKTEFSMSQKV
ncbi:MAG: hypothetical protein SGARI_003521, partial [Bacillariaceae sp.]